MTVETPTSIRVTRIINASPHQVFEAWTKADRLKQWSCPEGASVENVTTDLKVGGAYRIQMKTGEGQMHTAVGVYREIERPTRLVYTWNWEDVSDMPDSLVTVLFKAVGDSTEVIVHHDQFVDEKTAADHEMGWTSCLTKLEGFFGQGS